MSQRLHIGPTDSGVYDCVLTSTHRAYRKLREEWLCCEGGVFLGPWTIRIGDISLFRRLQGMLSRLLADVGVSYPQDVSVFYCGERCIEHPSPRGLAAWLKGGRK